MNEREAVAELARVLSLGSYRVQVEWTGEGSSDLGIDARLVEEDGSRILAVELKRLPTVRLTDILGFQARNALEARRLFPGRTGLALLAISLPRVTDATRDAVARFMGTYAPEMGWALVGDEGRTVLVVPEIGVELDTTSPRRRGRAVPSPRAHPLFTDRNCWLLKILLLQDAPTGLWGGPRGAIRNPGDLRRIGACSPATVSRFLAAMKEARFLSGDSSHLAVVRREELIRQWITHRATGPAARIPTRWLYGRIASVADLARSMAAKAGIQYAVGGYAACELLGVLHTTSRGIEVYFDGAVDQLVDEWRMEPCDARDADVVLVAAGKTRSILAGAVERHGLRCTDVLQAAVDVGGDPAGGRDQADYILHHVLKWRRP